MISAAFMVASLSRTALRDKRRLTPGAGAVNLHEMVSYSPRWDTIRNAARAARTDGLVALPRLNSAARRLYMRDELFVLGPGDTWVSFKPADNQLQALSLYLARTPEKRVAFWAALPVDEIEKAQGAVTPSNPVAPVVNWAWGIVMAVAGVGLAVGLVVVLLVVALRR